MQSRKIQYNGIPPKETEIPHMLEASSDSHLHALECTRLNWKWNLWCVFADQTHDGEGNNNFKF